MNKRILLPVLAVALACAVAIVVACGSNGDNGDGGLDSGTGDVGCWTNCGSDGGACTNLGIACTSSGECCSGNCLSGACQPPQCTSDNQACTSDGQCCGGKCTGGKCVPINPSCKSLGNTCTQGSECCSKFCLNGICAQPSYCSQVGDICSKPADCCGGICNIAVGASFGTCAQPPPGSANCNMVDGVVCSSSNNTSDGGIVYNDAGLPLCGGSCCSRDCAPWGPTNVLICQTASGCHPVGDICYQNSDCCGGLLGGNDPGRTTCTQPGPGQAGTCSNPNACKPNGDICKLWQQTCNADNNCCSRITPTQGPDDLGCHQDNLGVPRCSYAGDAGNCVPSSGSCATSADCCNLYPCVPAGDGGSTCYPQACVPLTGNCTNDGDCCSGGHCYIVGGQTTGTCQPLPDGGCDGGLYGQTCVTSTDCCNNVPCTNGRCEIVVN